LIAEYGEHFDIRRDIEVVSYTDFSSQKSADLLERKMPNLLVCDEAHALRDLKSARTKRHRRVLDLSRLWRFCWSCRLVRQFKVEALASLLGRCIISNIE